MNQLGPWYETVAPENKYQYNGIERNEELGLVWDMALFRCYDAAIGRWMQVDPLADFAPEWSVYRNAFDNPISFSDPYGLFESRKEARRYRREQREQGKKIPGRVKKQNDGTFAIVSRTTITSRDEEIAKIVHGTDEEGNALNEGVITAVNATAPGSVIPLASTRIEPATSTMGWLWSSFWSGNIQGGYRYNRDGYPVGLAPLTGTPPVGVRRVPKGEFWINLITKRPQGPGTYASRNNPYLKFLKERLKTDFSKTHVGKGSTFEPPIPDTRAKSKWKHFIDLIFGSFDDPRF